MKKTTKIPAKVQSFNEGEDPKMEISDDGLVYEPVKGQKVDVTYWVRYPSYDFIFGVPAKDNPYSKLEVGFFQYRNTKHKKVMMGLYVDCNELEEIAYGFAKIVEISKLMKTELWKKHKANKAKANEVEMPIPKSNIPMPTQKVKKLPKSKKK